MAKTNSEPGKRLDMDMSFFWDQHVENVRPAIKELDRQQVQAIADAITIVVTNETNPLRKGR